jgi:2-(1,2-epoxy-1,2-dihydrophenyl)acetyl-CoA isomerase
MTYEEISLEESGGVLTITFNRPAKLNAFTFKMLAEINRALAGAASAGARAIVVRGAGRAFCSGDDLSGMGGSKEHLQDMRDGHHRMIRRIRDLRIPVVAAIHGYAYGAGFEFALACDFRLAAESAFIGDIRAGRAINSMSGAAYWLPRYVGMGRATEILMLGEPMTARQALQWGILTRVFADAEFDRGIADFAARLAAMPTLALGANKMLLNFGLENYLADALDAEARELLEIIRTEDNQEGLHAFLEKRPARFTGR